MRFRALSVSLPAPYNVFYNGQAITLEHATITANMGRASVVLTPGNCVISPATATTGMTSFTVSCTIGATTRSVTVPITVIPTSNTFGNNSWAVIAQALLGDGDRAWEYYSLLAPQKALERVGLQVYKAEPYAWASNIVGPDNPKHGWANVTHITGTAAWMEMAAYHYLLGIRPNLNGLKISPVMPRPWRHMEVSYDYRGTMIQMYVENPDGVSGGVKRVMVDGAEAADGFVTWSTIQGKREVRIDVLLGEKSA